MNKTILLRTNIVVCSIIVAGFLLTAVISYTSNISILVNELEHVSKLTADGIYSGIDGLFSRPINVSQTMANDSLLKNFLEHENPTRPDPAYTRRLREYLDTYRRKYEYDSIFLVSTQTGRYYHYRGLDRILTPDNPENDWYYTFLRHTEEYSLNIDNDEASDNVITAFINCAIKNDAGDFLGVVGVGLRINSLQGLLKSYDDQFDIRAYLIDSEGVVQVASRNSKMADIENINTPALVDLKTKILSEKSKVQAFWYPEDAYDAYYVSRYIPMLGWYLVVENNPDAIDSQIFTQIGKAALILLLIVLLVLVTITRVIKDLNIRLVALAVARNFEYERLLHETTEGLYEHIFEFDITKRRAFGKATQLFYQDLNLPPDAPYDEALRATAEQQIKEEFRQGYLDTFSGDNVDEAYAQGVRGLAYEFQGGNESSGYHWIRITARLFFWASDNSIRMITYRQNIDEEKRNEVRQRDISQELAYQQLLTEVASGLYENIYELDITHGQAGSESTRRYFESLGVNGDTPYSDVLMFIARKQIKEEFIPGYLSLFDASNIFNAWDSGVNTLTYDMMVADGAGQYRWMRIIARLFYWDSDQSVRLISFRQDINAEKKRELALLERAQRDSLTGLCNKRTTEELISHELQAGGGPNGGHAFLIFDIDNFKSINDNLGHAFGDSVLTEFAADLKGLFRDSDIIGRIGGDEFVVLMRYYGGLTALKDKLEEACTCLNRIYPGEIRDYTTSASVGVALFPEHGFTYAELYEKADHALYNSKAHGKKTFHIFGGDQAGETSVHVSPRDMEALLHASSDGISKIACTQSLRLLYFNQRLMELTGYPANEMADPNFDVQCWLHPDDIPPALERLNKAVPGKEPFTVNFRIIHKDKSIVPVRVRGLFVHELYEGQYPIFYAVYTDLRIVR